LLTATVARGAIEEPTGPQVTPPRLGYVEGEVMFWRPGAGDWETAQLNIPLAAGDALATRNGKLELQIGGKSFIRAGEDTQVRLQGNDPDFLQLDVTAGHVTVDLRELRHGTGVRIDTPNAAVTINRDGYYRVDVDGETTRLAVRRGGQATTTPSNGGSSEIATGEAVEIAGTGDVQLTALAAPPFDDWDRWNYDRVDRLLAAPRSYSVPEDVYGGADLEQNGNWRYVNTYGRVWVPNSVAAGWAPYTDGRWLWDPLYGWSWVDYAPWGWAPFHYGRWVYPGYWAWAPGPVLAGPVYSPALVAFFGAPGFSVGFSFGFPLVSWVSLGWGEPLIPWWGPVGFIGAPCWRGWGGPHIVNNVFINNNNVVNVNNVNFYRNMNAPGGMVGVPRNQFDSRSLASARVTNFDRSQLQPVHGALPVESKTGAPGGLRAANVAGHGPFDSAPRGATTNFGRNGQGASPGTNFGRNGQAASPGTNFGRAGEPALGAQRAGVPSSGASNNRASSSFDALRGRGPGALTPPSRLNSTNPAGAATRSGDFARGQSPPPVPGAPRNAAVSSAFDSLRRSGNTATSGSFGRPAPPPSGSSFGRSAPPPPPRANTSSSSSTFGRPTVPSAGAANLRRSEAPPVPSNFGQARSGTASIRGSSAPAPQFGRAAVPQARPPAPAWPTGRVASARAPERAVARPAMPSMPTYRAPSMGAGASGNLRGSSGGSRGVGAAPSGGMTRGGGAANIGRAFGGLSAAGHGGGRGR